MTSRPTLTLLILLCLLFFAALGNHELQGSTEPRVAGIAMEMHLHGDWVTPRLNGEPFLEKPPLSLWLDAGFMKLFGPTTWAVRLASALAGLFCVLGLYAVLRSLGRPVWVAWGAALLLATMGSFWGNVRQVGEDALLCLGVTLALLAYLRISQGGQARWWGLFAAGIAIATLSKGVLGLALPGVVIFAWLVADSLLHKRLRLGAWLKPAAATLVGVLPLLVWLGFLYRDGGAGALADVLWANSVGRFDGSFEAAGHFEPFYYYLAKLPEAFLPWNLLVYLGLWHFRKQWRANPYLLFFSLWLLAQFALLTLASSKRTVYLMSLAPAAAVIAMEYLRLLRERYGDRWPKAPRAAQGVLAVVICSYLAVAVWVLPRQDAQQSFLPLTELIRSLEQDGKQVVLYTPSERLAGAGVFYSRSLLRALQTEDQLNGYLLASADHVAVMERDDDPPAPLVVLHKVVVGERAYYFVVR
ncbi:MAG: glycosyltransferase family 39 protein [Pseudomonas sp.]|nr:glycosyltransferase family 39 protein [Pseudomonas sp.]